MVEGLVRRLLYTLPSPALVSAALSLLKNLGVGVEVAGYTRRGLPVYAARAGRGDGGCRVLVIAGIHGNEPAPVNASLLALYMLATGRSVIGPRYSVWRLSREAELVAVPTANPEGLATYSECIQRDSRPSWMNTCSIARVNSWGMDLNRDWMYLTQPETRILHRLIDRVRPCLILDLHEFYGGEESPPRWAERVLGFMATLTDAPYMWVPEGVRDYSRKAMEAIARSIKELVGWKVEYRHFKGGDASGENAVALPSILGAHVALEGYPKVLVETWGIGLHSYLLDERVLAHAAAVMEALELVLENPPLGQSGIEHGAPRATYRVSGEEAGEAAEVLGIHGISFNRCPGYIEVALPQQRWRTAMILLDPECEYNRALAERGKGVFTLDRLYRVEIRRTG